MASGTRSTKVALVGNAKVGKTALMKRFLEDSFTTTYSPTIGIDYGLKSVQIQGNTKRTKSVNTVLVWDTAGEERFQASRNWFDYFKLDGLVLVYDCSDPHSFHQITSYFQENKYRASDKLVSTVLVGNKCDLEDDAKRISSSQGKALADSLGISFLETSAKESINVNKAFMMAALDQPVVSRKRFTLFHGCR